MAGGLLLDGAADFGASWFAASAPDVRAGSLAAPGPGHFLADLFVFCCFALVWRTAARDERLRLLLCLVIATAGEILLCFGAGLYDYRHGNLPLFVPLGHALIFHAGCRLAPRVGERAAALLAIGIAGAALAGIASGADRSAVLLLPIFLLCLLRRAGRRLHTLMMCMALVVEFAGTLLRSWTWQAAVPWLGLSQGNPPLLAGAFYCVLDHLVVGAESLVRRRAEMARQTQPARNDTPPNGVTAP